MTFDLERLIRDVTERRLCDPDWWKRHGIPMPEKYIAGQIEIPASIKKPDYSAERAAAWEYGDEP